MPLLIAILVASVNSVKMDSKRSRMDWIEDHCGCMKK